MATRERHTRFIIICSTVVMLVLAAVGMWLFFNHTPTPSLPKKIVSETSFPLYYPTPLPDGYTLNEKSVRTEGDTVYYELRNSTKNIAITVTQQATPASFDAAKLIGSAPIPNTIMPSGTLYNLSIGGASKYMFTTGDGTLLFITSTKTIPTTTVNMIARNFQQIKK